MEEARTSCMVVCGPSAGSVDHGSSVRSALIPRALFRNGEGDSQTMIAERSRTAPSDETRKPEPPCTTEDTEEGRRSRTQAWVAEAATQDTTWRFDAELPYQDQDVRLKQPEQASSHFTPESQRRSELSIALHPRRRSSIASQRTEPTPVSRSGRRSSIATQRTEPSLVSRPGRRSSIESQRTELSPDSRPASIRYTLVDHFQDRDIV